MSYTVTQLIIEAFYTSGIVGRQFQTVAGDQVQVGLVKLNELFADTGIDYGMIPYFNSGYSFNAIAGQEKYFIPNMVQPETLTFYIDTVRYSMRKNPRDEYFGMGRAENVDSLPFNWHAERTLNGTNIFIYFFPDKNFPLVATGLFKLQNVTLYQDLELDNVIFNFGSPVLNVAVGPGPFTLTPNQLVINGFDLQGTYPANLSARGGLISFINA